MSMAHLAHKPVVLAPTGKARALHWARAEVLAGLVLCCQIKALGDKVVGLVEVKA